jgi:hypothetical protein
MSTPGNWKDYCSACTHLVDWHRAVPPAEPTISCLACGCVLVGARDLAAENARLREALADAIECIYGYGDYEQKGGQTRWESDLARLRAALADSPDRNVTELSSPPPDEGHPAPTEGDPMKPEPPSYVGLNYSGPDPSVECAYPPCTNRLRKADFDGPQWCSKAHRTATESASNPSVAGTSSARGSEPTPAESKVEGLMDALAKSVEAAKAARNSASEHRCGVSWAFPHDPVDCAHLAEHPAEEDDFHVRDCGVAGGFPHAASLCTGYGAPPPAS